MRLRRETGDFDIVFNADVTEVTIGKGLSGEDLIGAVVVAEDSGTKTYSVIVVAEDAGTTVSLTDSAANAFTYTKESGVLEQESSDDSNQEPSGSGD